MGKPPRALVRPPCKSPIAGMENASAAFLNAVRKWMWRDQAGGSSEN
jgi:hypothetical protein